jgi:hypothetical protein
MNLNFYKALLGSFCLCNLLMLGLLAYEYEVIGRGLNPAIALIAVCFTIIGWFAGANIIERIDHE